MENFSINVMEVVSTPFVIVTERQRKLQTKGEHLRVQRISTRLNSKHFKAKTFSSPRRQLNPIG